MPVASGALKKKLVFKVEIVLQDLCNSYVYVFFYKSFNINCSTQNVKVRHNTYFILIAGIDQNFVFVITEQYEAKNMSLKFDKELGRFKNKRTMTMED